MQYFNGCKIFSKLVSFTKKRQSVVIANEPIIKQLNNEVANRVTNSLVKPSPGLNKLYNRAFKRAIVNDVIDLVLNLHKQLSLSFENRKIVLVAVLRSGFFLSELLKEMFRIINNKTVEVICVSPNYINNLDRGLKNLIRKSKKEFIFVDGWMSKGITYSILKKFLTSIKTNKKFRLAVLLNLSTINNNNIYSASKNDLLIPWSICQTDNSGLSNFFIHPFTKKVSCFYVPENFRVVKDYLNFCKKILQERIKTTRKAINNVNDYNSIKNKKEKYFKSKNEQKFLKIGINECLKSIDKEDVNALYISKKLTKSNSDILKTYAAMNHVPYKITNRKYCYVVRNYSQ